MNSAGQDFAGSSKSRKLLLATCWLLTATGVLGLTVVRTALVHVPLAAAVRTPGKPLVASAVAAASVLHLAPTAPEVPLIPAPAPPNLRGALPVGKGMWIWQPGRVEGGNPSAIVARAIGAGLNHLYVRTGSSVTGFSGGPFLDAILPAAHAAGIRIYGWDFPYLDDVANDAGRANAAIRYTTPTGHRIDGFAADIELRSMGVNITPETTSLYGSALRAAVGPGYPLIAVVPRPSPRLAGYPYESITGSFDAIAPMVYWMQTDPAHAVNLAFDRLAPLGKPIIPIGQAYDGFAEGGPAGVPSPKAIHRFMETAMYRGAPSVSFWSWQHANDPAWLTIAGSPLFNLPIVPNDAFRGDQIRAYQVLLSSLGFGVPWTGAWGPESVAAVSAFQTASRIPVTGVIDAVTRQMLLQPVGPPLH